jgi:hypothetical protein
MCNLVVAASNLTGDFVLNLSALFHRLIINNLCCMIDTIFNEDYVKHEIKKVNNNVILKNIQFIGLSCA